MFFIKQLMLIQKDKTAIICEMSQTYEGSFDMAEKIVKCAIGAKADAIKFQVFQADELATSDYKYYELFKKLELFPEQWKKLIDQAHEGGILTVADVFGIESAKMLIQAGIDAFKIHPTDVKNIPLLEFLAKSGKSLLLSAGGSTKEEIQKAINILQSQKSVEIILMHGFQSYPTLIEDTNLNKIRILQKTFHLPTGFADHIDGGHELKFDLCEMALGIGVKVIEKHITLDRKLEMEDYESALDPDVFSAFVERIRTLEKALGKESFEFCAAEKKYRQETKKHIVAGHDLAAGQIIKPEDIVMKRTSEEYEFQKIEDIAGQTLIKPVAKDKVIKLEDLKAELSAGKKRVVAALACRVQSTRLYAKPLQLIDIENNVTILEYLVKQLQSKKEIDQVVLAISEGEENNPFVKFAEEKNLDYVVGSEKDVLGRLIAAGEKGRADIVFRTTSECPFVYLDNLDEILEKHISGNMDLTVIEHLPECVYYELVNLTALKKEHQDGEDRHRSEFCTLYINENPEKFNIQKIGIEDPSLRRPEIRIVVDYPEDLIVVREIYKALARGAKDSFIPIKDIINYLDSHPELKALNGWIDAGEGRIWE